MTTATATHASAQALPETAVQIDGVSTTITVESGIVLGVRRLSETEVSGYVSNGSGDVSSTIHRRTEFSVLGTDGVERPHTFFSHDLFLRDGHRVSIIHLRTAKAAHWAFLVNHDTRETLLPWDRKLVYRLGLVQKVSLWLLPLFGIGCGLLLSQKIVSDTAGSALIQLSFGTILVAKTVQTIRSSLTWKNKVCPLLARTGAELLAATDTITWPSTRS